MVNFIFLYNVKMKLIINQGVSKPVQTIYYSIFNFVKTSNFISRSLRRINFKVAI